MKNFNAEMIEKAKVAKSVEELLEIAKANNIEMTADEAATYFAQLNPKSGELNDDDLDAVAGGAGGCMDIIVGKTARVTSGECCPTCGSKIGVIEFAGSYGGQFIVCCGNIFANTQDCSYEVID